MQIYYARCTLDGPVIKKSDGWKSEEISRRKEKTGE